MGQLKTPSEVCRREPATVVERVARAIWMLTSGEEATWNRDIGSYRLRARVVVTDPKGWENP